MKLLGFILVIFVVICVYFPCLSLISDFFVCFNTFDSMIGNIGSLVTYFQYRY